MVVVIPGGVMLVTVTVTASASAPVSPAVTPPTNRGLAGRLRGVVAGGRPAVAGGARDGVAGGSHSGPAGTSPRAGGQAVERRRRGAEGGDPHAVVVTAPRGAAAAHGVHADEQAVRAPEDPGAGAPDGRVDVPVPQADVVDVGRVAGLDPLGEAVRVADDAERLAERGVRSGHLDGPELGPRLAVEADDRVVDPPELEPVFDQVDDVEGPLGPELAVRVDLVVEVHVHVRRHLRRPGQVVHREAVPRGEEEVLGDQRPRTPAHARVAIRVGVDQVEAVEVVVPLELADRPLVGVDERLGDLVLPGVARHRDGLVRRPTRALVVDPVGRLVGRVVGIGVRAVFRGRRVCRGEVPVLVLARIGRVAGVGHRPRSRPAVLEVPPQRPPSGRRLRGAPSAQAPRGSAGTVPAGSLAGGGWSPHRGPRPRAAPSS